jgi:hypothetical protein
MKDQVKELFWYVVWVMCAYLGKAFIVLAEWMLAAACVVGRFVCRSGRRTLAIAIIVLAVIAAIKGIGEPGQPFTADSALRVLALVVFLLLIGFGAGREGRA